MMAHVTIHINDPNAITDELPPGARRIDLDTDVDIDDSSEWLVMLRMVCEMINFETLNPALLTRDGELEPSDHMEHLLQHTKLEILDRYKNELIALERTKRFKSIGIDPNIVDSYANAGTYEPDDNKRGPTGNPLLDAFFYALFGRDE